MTFRHDERARGFARQAYQAFEPLHLVAYFGPQVREVAKEEGLGFYPSYAGFRAAPMGAASPSVVSAAFYNWNPEKLEAGWQEALSSHSPEQLLAARERIADKGLTAALGDLRGHDALPRLADRLNEVLAKADRGGRPLGAANLALTSRRLDPHVELWQAFTTWREWRGDGHVAVLVANGIGPIEALVFHESEHPDPSVKASRMGRAQTQQSRAWSEEQWNEAAESLRSRGLLEADAERLTAAGADLYKKIEDETDDVAAGVWAGVDDADEIFASARPFVKAVIDSGMLPGTPAAKK